MNRTFHRHLSIAGVCGIIVFSILAFFLFWSKSPVAGLALALVVVLMTERMLHTSYIFTQERGEQLLVIDRGRLARRQVVRLSEVVKVMPMKRLGGLSRFVMVVYGSDRMVAVEPENEDAFCKELMKRLKAYDETNE
ncbi:hypothetical protein [Segatella baroniae]|nr:hypothetical protein [Segatella baroniae]